jgi:uncharacterized protein
VTAIRFQWDDRKAAANKAKHGVSFEEAKSVFYDDDALLRSDDEHSADEDRFVLLGLSANLRVLVVCHCYRESDEVVRLISARKADRSERQQYEARRRR